MPVTTGFVNIPTSSGSAQTIFLDSSRVSEIAAVREDFASSGLAELMAPLDRRQTRDPSVFRFQVSLAGSLWTFARQ